ncbi:hypothetical protein [Litoreibacter janthinus]|uniref:LysE type translocator n=1 Tax=Litoreibacter janthinus TaxID=670154 RepID=A0A1I6FPX7_9RHOB|nr:hypothetical protein [Litoreibacter janthinus]SFR31999.1 hypothetical protein SAMN04488002_0047 [Litoreibacter janthinus]
MITAQFLLTALVVVLAPSTGVIDTLAMGLGQGQLAVLWAALGCTVWVFVLHGLFAARARDAILGSERVLKWLNRSFAAIFVGLAGKLALERA